jgi:hypothetical protein
MINQQLWNDETAAIRPGWQFELYDDDIAGDAGAGYYILEFGEPECPVSGNVEDDDQGGWRALVLSEGGSTEADLGVYADPAEAQRAVEERIGRILAGRRRQLIAATRGERVRG